MAAGLGNKYGRPKNQVGTAKWCRSLETNRGWCPEGMHPYVWTFLERMRWRFLLKFMGHFKGQGCGLRLGSDMGCLTPNWALRLIFHKRMYRYITVGHMGECELFRYYHLRFLDSYRQRTDHGHPWKYTPPVHSDPLNIPFRVAGKTYLDLANDYFNRGGDYPCFNYRQLKDWKPYGDEDQRLGKEERDLIHGACADFDPPWNEGERWERFHDGYTQSLFVYATHGAVYYCFKLQRIPLQSERPLFGRVKRWSENLEEEMRKRMDEEIDRRVRERVSEYLQKTEKNNNNESE